VHIDNRRGFQLGTSSLYVTYFYQITLLFPLLTHPLSPCSPNIQQLTVQCIKFFRHHV
jgi:hypothetical protein